jgi:probable HAF family extracellular repeat protein
MRKLLRSFWLCVGIHLFLLAVAATANAQVGWTVTDLGTLGGNFSNAEDINELGHVVGSSHAANGQEHAFLWTPSTGMIDLGTLGGTFSSATGVNDTGQVVGLSLVAAGGTRAFRWTAAGGMIDLGTLGGSHSAAWAVNQAGQVVGDAAIAGPFGSGPSHAFLWSPPTGMIDLGTLGGTQSSAKGINEAGHVVGLSDTANGDEHAFLWTESTGMIDLGTLGGQHSTASDINGAGQVVGRSDTANGDVRAFMWTQSTGMIDLGTVDGAERSQAEGINETEEIVGFFNPNEDHGFHWTAGGGMIELPTLGGIESRGMAINNAGQVTGFAETTNFDEHAVIWSRNTLLTIGIDIKPGSYPNCFNLNGQGVIPVALLGSPDLNVLDIDQGSLLFEGLSVRVRGNRWPQCSVEDSNSDAFGDLVCQFVDDSTNWTGGGATAKVVGRLFDGTTITGEDSICVVP